MYYIHNDHLGSIDVISKQDGTIKERYNFDPWGRRRNPLDWSYNNIPTSFFINRGFTGHEHLDQFSLINMNGRIYDPFLAMFISPDNFVQSPTTSIGFNRYSYCLNNPLIYTDPTGDFIFTSLFAICCPLLEPLGVMLDGACWSASRDAISQGVRILSGKQSKFNFAELGGAAAGGAVFAGMSLNSPKWFLPTESKGFSSRFTFSDYFSFYLKKASYASRASMTSYLVGSEVTSALGGHDQNDLLKNMTGIGLFSFVSSFANSFMHYFTWDRYSLEERVDMLRDHFSDNTVFYNNTETSYSGTLRVDGSIGISPIGMSSKSCAYYSMNHEKTIARNIRSWIEDGRSAPFPTVEQDAESAAYFSDLTSESLYKPTMNDWLVSMRYLQKGGLYSNFIPRRYLFNFNLLKILRNY